MAFIPRTSTTVFALVALTLALAGCNQDQGSSNTGTAAGASTASGANSVTGQGTVSRTPPTIDGNPSAAAFVGLAYSFKPTTTDPSGGVLTFSIKNQPSWTTFDPTSGTLSGTPSAANLGVYQSISIAVSDGSSTAAFAPFTILVAPASNASAPTISGTPSPTVLAGAVYVFRPTTTDPSGGKLTFSVQNLPKWAVFDAGTGTVSGTPTAADVGAYAKIDISVTDGVSTASLTPFAIDVTQPSPGNVALSWAPPTKNTNGTASTDLAGYHIYYGASAKSMTKVVNVSLADTSYVFSALPAGSWYFAVAAYNTADVESSLSAVVSVEL